MKTKFLLLMLLVSPSVMAQDLYVSPDTTEVSSSDTVLVEPEPQPITVTAPSSDLSDVEAFKRLADGAEGTLELEHDTVLFVRGDDAFLRSGYGRAIMFSQTGLPLKQGQIILGSVTGRKASFEGGMPIFIGTAKTSASDYEVVGTTVIDGLERQLEFERLEKGIEYADVQSFVGDIVMVDSMTVTASREVSGVRYFSVACADDDGVDIEIVDKYGYCEGDVPAGAICRGVSGILLASADRILLYPLADISRYAVMPAGIDRIESSAKPGPGYKDGGAVYDLLGRRVGALRQKGVYIIGGRKQVTSE